MNIAHMLAWSVRRHAGRVAFTTPTVSRTYGEIDQRTNALAQALRALGIAKGDRVGVLIGNQVLGVDITIYGLLLILFIIYMPKGILGAVLERFGARR